MNREMEEYENCFRYKRVFQDIYCVSCKLCKAFGSRDRCDTLPLLSDILGAPYNRILIITESESS